MKARIIKLPLGPESAIKFPDCCVVCGGASSESRNLIVSRQREQNGKTLEQQITLHTRMCKPCFAHDSKIFFVTLFPFLLFGLGGAALCFWLTLPYTPEVESSTNPALGLALPLSAALFGGIIVGSITEVAARILAFPIVGRSIFSTPLFLTELIANKSAILGLTAWISKDGSEIELNFANALVAEKLGELTPTSNLKPADTQ